MRYKKLAIVAIFCAAFPLQSIAQWNDRTFSPTETLTIPFGLLGQWADFGTTFLAVTTEVAVEANPLVAPLTEGWLGWSSLFIIKTGSIFYSYSQPIETCQIGIAVGTAIGIGATVNNIFVIANFSNPLGWGISLGILAGAFSYETGQAEKECIQGAEWVTNIKQSFSSD